MTKITYIVSDINKALAFEWIATHLNKEKFELDFILLNKGNSQLETFLMDNQILVRRIKLYPGWRMIFTFFPLWFILLRKRPPIIHTHLRYASLLGITAGYFSRIKSRIHTRHHAASNHLYYPHAVKHDKWISTLSTKVVSISDVVTEVLFDWEGVSKAKIIKIPHGFDLDLFYQPDQVKVTALKKKYIPRVQGPVIGMISRYIHLKGIEYCIHAFKEILIKYPNAHLILANASEPNSNNIKTKLELLPRNAYTEITFEPDIASLYQLFDIFVHTPISKHSEAFGQTYIEALASGIPSIFTLSGIANEMIVHNENAWVVPFKDSKAIEDGILEILLNDALRTRLKQRPIDLLSTFALDKYIQKLEDLYSGE